MLSNSLYFSVLPGQHDSVTMINNFFSRTRLEYYTRPQGLEKEPILPPKLAEPLHKIIMTTNLNLVGLRDFFFKCIYCILFINNFKLIAKLHIWLQITVESTFTAFGRCLYTGQLTVLSPYTSEQLRVKSLAEVPNRGNLAVVRFEPGTFRTMVQ